MHTKNSETRKLEADHSTSNGQSKVISMTQTRQSSLATRKTRDATTVTRLVMLPRSVANLIQEMGAVIGGEEVDPMRVIVIEDTVEVTEIVHPGDGVIVIDRTHLRTETMMMIKAPKEEAGGQEVVADLALVQALIDELTDVIETVMIESEIGVETADADMTDVMIEEIIEGLI